MKTLPVKQLKPNLDNPRFIRDEKFQKLKQSLKDFPEMLHVRPLVVNSDYVVLGGNMRLRAAQELGIKELPVEIVDWSEEQQKEFLVKDNASFGSWDWDVIANEWDEQLLTDWGLDLPVKDFFELPDDEPGDEEPKPRGSADDYAVFEVVMHVGNKERLTETLSKVRDSEGLETIEDSLMHIVNAYND